MDDAHAADGEERADAGSDGPVLSDAAVARRAYEISLTDPSGSPEENWARAEEELRCEHDSPA